MGGIQWRQRQVYTNAYDICIEVHNVKKYTRTGEGGVIIEGGGICAKTGMEQDSRDTEWVNEAGRKCKVRG